VSLRDLAAPKLNIPLWRYLTAGTQSGRARKILPVEQHLTVSVRVAEDAMTTLKLTQL
jgi:hypothetical protein